MWINTETLIKYDFMVFKNPKMVVSRLHKSVLCGKLD